jgi:biotin carboxyl carrier protein
MNKRRFKIKIDGKVFDAEVEEIAGQTDFKTDVLPQIGEIESSKAKKPMTSALKGKAIVAPMPGKVLSIKVSKGQAVKNGDIVLILEAMKMEQEIRIHQEGIITEIYISEGDTVQKEQTLILFESEQNHEKNYD